MLIKENVMNVLSNAFLRTVVLFVAPIILLIIAIFPMQYSYYTFLRCYIFLSGIAIWYLWFKGYKYDLSMNVFVLAGVIILFNPFLVFAMSKLRWVIVDISAAVFFALCIIPEAHLYFKNKKTEKVFNYFTPSLWLPGVVMFAVVTLK